MSLTTLTLGEALQTIEASFDNVLSDIALNDSTIEEITYAVNNALWIRDYLVGLPADKGMTNSIKFINYLSSRVPASDRFAYDTVMAIFQYEQGNKEISEHLLELASEVNPNYSMAKLIKRVLQANWPTTEFATMRSQLAGSVKNDLSNHSSQVIAEMGA